MTGIKYILLLTLLFLARGSWTNNHEITGEASKQISAGVKATFLSGLSKLANQDLANQLRNDLNTDDDSKRTVKSIDVLSANQIYSIFGLKDPGCDKDKDGQVSGDELTCLGKIWKYFVPK